MRPASVEPSPPPKLGDALDFLRLIWAVDHGLHRGSKHTEMTMGVTSPQRLAIRIIGRFPGIPAGHLARLLQVHPGTASGMVKRLVRQGLVRHRPDPRDGRRTLLGLTDKGRSVDVETESVVEGAIRTTLENTAPEKVLAAREVLESLVASLSAAFSPR